MLKRRGYLFVLLGLLSASMMSCSEFRQLQKSNDWKAKFDGAMRYYEEGDYYRAIALYEEILPVTRGKAEGEQAQFYYAYAHYNDNQFILSAHYF
jgi:outer membrane protein assembly factor BamD